MDYHRFNAISDHVGPYFLKYILNLDILPLPYNYELFNSIQFTQEQVEVLHELEKLITEAGRQAAMNSMYGVKSFLINIGINNVGLFNNYRKHCGGSIHSITSSDLLSKFTLDCLEHMYPSFLIASLHDDPVAFSESAYEHRGLDDQFLTLLAADLNISSLILKEEHFSQFGYLLENGFMIIRFHRSVLSHLLLRAFYNCVYRLVFSLESVGAEVLEHIDQIRKISRQEEVEFSQFIGLRGFKLEEHKACELISGWIIRPISDQFLPVKVMAKTYSILNTTPVGSILEIRHKSKGKVLPKEYQSFFNLTEIPRKLNNLKLATVFATEAIQAPFGESFGDISLPMNRVPIYFPFNQSFPPGAVVSSNSIDAIRDWFTLLNSSDLHHVSIPLKRLELSIFQLRDEEDSIIDAVIAWEGMFSAKFETTFQVCLTIAKFLKSELSERKSFFKRLKQLYGYRSSLAHGSIEIKDFQKKKKENPSEVRNEILSIGLECLKMLLHDKELLKLTPEDRIKEILLR